MVNTSYTVSISDTVADASTVNDIQGVLNEARKKVKDIFNRGIAGKMESNLVNMMDSFEVNVFCTE